MIEVQPVELTVSLLDLGPENTRLSPLPSRKLAPEEGSTRTAATAALLPWGLLCPTLTPPLPSTKADTAVLETTVATNSSTNSSVLSRGLMLHREAAAWIGAEDFLGLLGQCAPICAVRERRSEAVLSPVRVGCVCGVEPTALLAALNRLYHL